MAQCDYYIKASKTKCNNPIVYDGRFGKRCEKHATSCSTCYTRKSNRDVFRYLNDKSLRVILCDGDNHWYNDSMTEGFFRKFHQCDQCIKDQESYVLFCETCGYYYDCFENNCKMVFHGCYETNIKNPGYN